MNDQDWEKFAALLVKIMHMGGTWQEKREEIKNHVDEDHLEEFIAWFTAEDK